ncbi:MAG: sigma-70 family RNA polymerase sigma factor [Ardenticatenales bacterium]
MTIIFAERPREREPQSAALSRSPIAADTERAIAARGDVDDSADLAARAARGEPGAFAALYQRHVEIVYHYFRFRVRDTTVAEDLTHDVFVQALKAVRTLREPQRVAAWLMRIAHNRLANHWRDGAHDAEPFGLDEAGMDEAERLHESLSPAATPLGLDHGAATADPAARLDVLADIGRVAAAVAGLTALQQDVIALRFVVGLNIAETAEAMGRTGNAVKNLQHQALAKLRRDLIQPPQTRRVRSPQ